MKQNDFQEFLNNVSEGDFIGVRIRPEASNLENIPSVLTEFGDGELCHVEYAINNITVISADGQKVSYNSLEKYKNILDQVELFILFVKNIKDDDIKKMTAFEISRIGTLYNWDIIKNQAIKLAMCKIPVIGFFINKYIWKKDKNKTPMSGTICSKECALTVRTVISDFLSDKNIDDISPSDFLESEMIGIKNKY
jgi:hypothetical protein